MNEVAILTPNPNDPSFASQWPEVLERLTRTLDAGGITVRPEAWTEHQADGAKLAEAPLVLALLAWGYHRDHAAWLSACATWQAAGVRLCNPASVLQWNSDKAYLKRLHDAGIPIAPTVWSDQVTPDQIAAAFDMLGTDHLVVKPQVSGGGWQTTRLGRGDALTEVPTGPALIQRFIPAFEAEGELSLLFFSGRFSHAVRKRAKAGEFRIQVQFGGLYAPDPDPDPAALALAEQVLATVAEPLLYARIDLARDGDGHWLLMEAELVEPDLYLEQSPDHGAAFTAALRARVVD